MSVLFGIACILFIVCLCFDSTICPIAQPQIVSTDKPIPMIRPKPKSRQPLTDNTSTNVLTNPRILASGTGFGQFCFVHDKGIIAISDGDPPTTLQMYQIGTTIVSLDPIVLPQTLTTHETAILCYGTFMPSLNTLDEFYYLIVTMGIRSATYPTYRFGRELYLYAADTTRQPYSFRFSMILQHPYFTHSPSTLPYVGCFGNRLQGVLDDNDIQNVRQSLYISATEWEPLNPERPQPSRGGAVFWYIFFSNEFQPDMTLQFVMQDAKLNIISKLDDTKAPSPLLADIDYYMNGFGSVFYVQSGQSVNNFLAIANLTNQDTLDFACDTIENRNAPHGYVQCFSLGTGRDQPEWLQEFKVCNISSASGFNQQLYVNRFTPHPTDEPCIGFGAGLLIVQNFLIVAMSQTDTASHNGLLSFNLSSGHLPPPTNLHAWGSVNLSAKGFSSNALFPSPTFNRNLFLLNGLLGVLTYDTSVAVNTLGFFNTPYSNIAQQTPDLFQVFGDPLELIGGTESHGSSTDSLIGYGQWVGQWRSAGALVSYMVINDPLDNRVFVYQTSV